MGRTLMHLVVEDDVSILRLTRIMLELLGYRVLTAKSAAEALHIADAHPGEISLLITDVVMPEMDGRKLSETLQSSLPQLKCLFMSGYTADVIAHRGILEKDINFIHKPFTRKNLAVVVRDVLCRR